MSQGMALSAESNPKRQVAYSVGLANLLSAEFVRGEGWDPSYVLCFGKKMSRVNIMGVVVSRGDERGINALRVDDSTGVIPVYSFDGASMMEKSSVGDCVLVVGRPRVYGEERYLVPEIIKKLEDLKWLEVRKLELEKLKNIGAKVETEKVVVEEESDSNSSKIYEIIKQMDSGDGVDIDDVIVKAAFPNAEQVINNLLREGDIFEVRAGRVKVLE